MPSKVRCRPEFCQVKVWWPTETLSRPSMFFGTPWKFIALRLYFDKIAKILVICVCSIFQKSQIIYCKMHSQSSKWHRGLMVRRCFPVQDLAEIAGSNPVGVVELFLFAFFCSLFVAFQLLL